MMGNITLPVILPALAWGSGVRDRHRARCTYWLRASAQRPGCSLTCSLGQRTGRLAQARRVPEPCTRVPRMACCSPKWPR
jgi:hypothetical protein